jgi:RNA-binding protein PNO1
VSLLVPHSKMVVAIASESASSATHVQRKNRRKLVRKNGAKPVLSARRPAVEQDEEMNDITETADIDASTSAALFAPPSNPRGGDDDDDEVMIDTDPSSSNPTAPSASTATGGALFPPASASAQKVSQKSETRRIPIPPHRMTPLKKDWVNLFGPLTEILGLQVRMNVQRRCVEMRVSIS